MRHLGSFGCIITAIFSENATLLKKQILEQIYVAVFTAHQVQFHEVFAIFINLDIPRVSRKLLKICLETTADDVHIFYKISE